MGDRANVRFVGEDGTIHLYTHWHGEALPGLLAVELGKPETRRRWNDDAYLVRRIITGIVHEAGDCESETGWGVSVGLHDGGDRILTVDTRTKTVTIQDGPPYAFDFYIDGVISNTLSWDRDHF